MYDHSAEYGALTVYRKWFLGYKERQRLDWEFNGFEDESA